MTLELQPTAISTRCFGAPANNIHSAANYNTVRSLKKNYLIFTYERVVRKETGKKKVSATSFITGDSRSASFLSWK